ncbi:hypothetical protein ACVWWG_000499 [Bradyrhizobium sp. LB7.2]
MPGYSSSRPEAFNRRSTVTIMRSPAPECAVEPIGIAEATGQFAEPDADAILQDRQALLVPALVALEQHGHPELDDRRLQRAQRGKHPRDHAGSGVRIVRQQPGMALRDMEHDRAGFEQSEIAILEGRDLRERMQREMCGLLHVLERDQTDVVGLTHLLERPAHPHVARLSPAAVGRAFEGGDGGGHLRSPFVVIASAAKQSRLPPRRQSGLLRRKSSSQ